MSDGQTERTRYHKEVATLDPDHPWHRIQMLIPVGARVLDVGCGSGELARMLSDRAESVDGIEANPERAENARQYMRTVITGEAGPSIDSSLPSPYDVVIFADVLEHMSHPEEILRWAGSKLSPSGRIIALIPNSAHWKARRKILKGDWSYEDTGYFDRDHLRFFDVRTARQLGATAGLEEVGVEFTPEQLPKPLRDWKWGAAFATRRSPNMFAGHVLVIWRAPAPG